MPASATRAVQGCRRGPCPCGHSRGHRSGRDGLCRHVETRCHHYPTWPTGRTERRRVLTSCGRLCDRLVDHRGDDPFGLCHLVGCRGPCGPCRRSDLPGSGRDFCPYRHDDDPCGRGRRGLGEVCCVCRRSHSRGCRACDHHDVGAHHTNRSSRGREGGGHAVCYCAAVASLEECRSLTRIRKNTTSSCLCVGVGDCLGYVSIVACDSGHMNAYLWAAAGRLPRNAPCVVAHLVGRRDSHGCREDLRWGVAAPIWACRPRSYRSGSWAPLGNVSCVTSEAAEGRPTTSRRRIVTSSHVVVCC